MIPYMHPEFIEALMSPAASRWVKDAPAGASPKPFARKKGKGHFPSLRRSAARIRSLIVPVVTKFILLLIYICL
jgi:hypothetical protein